MEEERFLKTAHKNTVHIQKPTEILVGKCVSRDSLF